MDGSFGRKMGEAIVGMVILFALGGIAVGVVLTLAVPWMWHFAAAHVSFH